ncbi:hypothetical protein EMIT043CA1_160079 [Pseudomonas brassicacearum]
MAYPPFFGPWSVDKTLSAAAFDRASAGNLDDLKPVGDGISELRVDVALATGSISPCAVAWLPCY